MTLDLRELLPPVVWGMLAFSGVGAARRRARNISALDLKTVVSVHGRNKLVPENRDSARN